MRSERGDNNLLDSLLSAKRKIKIFRARDAQYYFRLYDYNGDILLTSQGASSEEECRANLEVARRAAARRDCFKSHLTKDSKFTYFLLDDTRKVLAVGAMYNTVRDCDDAVKTLKDVFDDSVVEGPPAAGTSA